MATFEDFLSEGKKIQIKRKYTENHPASTVGKTANVRNAVLKAIKDGVVTREEYNKILSELSADSRQWSSRNRKYFNVSEEGIKLSKWGLRILNELDSEEEEMVLSDEVNEKVKITKDKWPYVEFKDGGKKYEVEFDDYEEIDDHGNEGKDVFFIGYDQDDNEWQVDVSVGYNYENSGEIYDIYWDTLQKVDESAVTEKFVKEFDKAVLDAETEADVLKVYPDAEFYVGKMSHFFGQLEKNLFFKAYYAKYYQEDYGKKIKGDFKITSIYSEKGSRYVNLYVHESAIVEKDDAGTHLDNLESIVGKARDFFAIGKELDKGGYKKKYFYSDTMAPSYTIEIDGFKFAIINKKYVDKGDREVGDIAIGLLENMNTNIKNNLDMKNTLNIFESFSNFLDFNLLNESFKSMRFAELFMSTSTYSGDKKFNKELVKAFYNRTKINLQKVEDEDLLTIDPVTAYKNKTPNTIVFYISDNEKENPYAPYDTYSSNKRIPGGGYLLAMGTGKNEFLGVQWSRYSQERSLSRVDKGDSYSSVGISKKYKGWDATGLYNVKRIAEVADRAVVINVELLQQKYSTAELRSSRENARKGATAFKSDKAFKDENQARYREILNNKAAKLPLDKMVKDAIDVLAKQLSDGLSKGEMTKYNEIKIGTDPRGREVKAKDASSHMTSILDDYARYVDYIRQAEESEARYGDRESYYERESKAYAKRIKDKIKKIESYDYAW